MPLYEYRCKDCGEFEAWRSLSEYNAPMACPECDAMAVKIFTAPNINLNSGSLSAIAKNPATEPRVVKRKSSEPTQPRYQQVKSNRPWMISHTKP